MPNRDIIAIGASAGGVDALRRIVEKLPADLPAALLITLHLPRTGSLLDEILARAGPLPCVFAKEGDRPELGHIYVAPPDRHLLLIDGVFRLGAGARENFSRPAIDPMMRSVAVCCGPRAVGVILTGDLGDGAAGLSAIARCGGLTIVQDPEDAANSDMPRHALGLLRPDHLTTIAQAPVLIDALARQDKGEPVEPPPALRMEVKIALGQSATLDAVGARSTQTCPTCYGALWQIQEGKGLRFRCHTGHAFSAEAVEGSLADEVRDALAIALRAVQARVSLLEDLENKAKRLGRKHLSKEWGERLRECQRELHIVRSAIGRVDAAARVAGEVDESDIS